MIPSDAVHAIQALRQLCGMGTSCKNRDYIANSHCYRKLNAMSDIEWAYCNEVLDNAFWISAAVKDGTERVIIL